MPNIRYKTTIKGSKLFVKQYYTLRHDLLKWYSLKYKRKDIYISKWLKWIMGPKFSNTIWRYEESFIDKWFKYFSKQYNLCNEYYAILKNLKFFGNLKFSRNDNIYFWTI